MISMSFRLLLVLFLCLNFCSVSADKIILNDEGSKIKLKEMKITELEIQSLDNESNEEPEICDLSDPDHCKTKVDLTEHDFKVLKYADLTKEQKELVDAADKVTQNSHSPYSKFRVGSALRCKDNSIVTGTNFENAAYGSTICAERAAIFRANAKGKKEFKQIAIIGRGADFDSEDPISPCGACRQVILEIAHLSDTDIEVIMSNSKKDKIIISSITELLPLGFGPQNLGIELKK